MPEVKEFRILPIHAYTVSLQPVFAVNLAPFLHL